MKVFGAIGVLLVLGLSLGGCAILKSTQETVTIKVKDKERITESGENGSTSSKYLVFTENETFEDTDTLLFGKFNSSDVYGGLDKGKSYTCKVYGWRIHFLSHYRNIVSCSPA